MGRASRPTDFVQWYDGDVYHRPFDPAALIRVIQETMDRFPGCSVGRAGNDICNLVVYDADGEYVGVIELHDAPEIALFRENDD